MIKYTLNFHLKGNEKHEDDMAAVQDQAEKEDRVSRP
jgi:hypothetical protein